MVDPAAETVEPSDNGGDDATLMLSYEKEFGRYDRKLWIVEPVTPAAYPAA